MTEYFCGQCETVLSAEQYLALDDCPVVITGDSLDDQYVLCPRTSGAPHED